MNIRSAKALVMYSFIGFAVIACAPSKSEAGVPNQAAAQAEQHSKDALSKSLVSKFLLTSRAEVEKEFGTGKTTKPRYVDYDIAAATVRIAFEGPGDDFDDPSSKFYRKEVVTTFIFKKEPASWKEALTQLSLSPLGVETMEDGDVYLRGVKGVSTEYIPVLRTKGGEIKATQLQFEPVGVYPNKIRKWFHNN